MRKRRRQTAPFQLRLDPKQIRVSDEEILADLLYPSARRGARGRAPPPRSTRRPRGDGGRVRRRLRRQLPGDDQAARGRLPGPAAHRR